MALVQIAPPDEEPVTLDEMKAHLSQTLDTDDVLIEAKTKAARVYIERQIGKPLMATEFELVLDAFPAGIIEMPGGRVLIVESVKFLDSTTGLETTLAADQYVVDTDSQPARLAPNTGWPATASRLNAVRVRFLAGYGDEVDDVPDDLREAIKQLAAHWYENREAAVVGVPVALLPLSVGATIREHRNYSFDG